MKLIKATKAALGLCGIHPEKAVQTLSGIPWYFRDMKEIKRQAGMSQFKFPLARPFPCLGERGEQSGGISGHYFAQDLAVARRIYQLHPVKHVDVGSRIDGFVTHVACFREIEIYDIRPLDADIPNVKFKQADLMQLDSSLIESTDSLSCLHTIEHFGLGRYGDPIDYDGFDKGIRNLARILKPGGRLHFSVPLGPQRIEFNAHRVFSADFLKDYLSKLFTIERFSYIDDSSRLHENISLDHGGWKNSFGCRYGCAIFELIK